VILVARWRIGEVAVYIEASILGPAAKPRKSGFLEGLNSREVYETRINTFFKIKDLTPRNLQSHVVYEVKCAECNARYIGKTIRHIETRLNEHKKSSGLLSQSKSHIAEHASITGHHIDYDGFKVLGRANTDYVLTLKESLLIKKFSPSLNQNQTSVPLNLF